MLNSVTHGRRQAHKALIVQLVAVAATALALLIASPAHALSAALGGGALAPPAALVSCVSVALVAQILAMLRR